MTKRYWFVIAFVILLVGGFVIFQSLRESGNEQLHPDTNSEASGGEKAVELAGLPLIRSVSANSNNVGLYERFELAIDLQAVYDNPYDPEQIDLHAEFESPDGSKWKINGFFDGAGWKLRFAPNEVGTWKYRISATDANGTASDEWRSFEAAASMHHGWIKASDSNPRFLAYDDGSSFFGVGVAYPWNVSEYGLDRIVEHGGNLITYWNGNYDASGNGGGNDQLESVDSGIGNYDLLKGARIDELVEQFEARNLHMNFVVWPHDSLADNIDWPAAWDQNAYSALGEAVEFYESEEMWKYQEKLYRYIIARWGHSRAIGIWDLICEINGTDGWQLGDKQKANEWADKVHQYFKENDPYGHPTMGSMAGGLADYWEHGYGTFDIADRENYYDLHFSAYAADIQKRWNAYEKPLFIGESGNVTDAKIYHNAIWVSLANGLSSSPIWWDMGKMNDDEMLGQMRHFSTFVNEIDFLEPREPVELATATIEKILASEVVLEDGRDLADWSLPDWADANKNSSGQMFPLQADGEAVSTQMRFATGGYAQGVAQQTIEATDWTGYNEFSFDVYIEHDGKEQIKARPVLFPDGQWTEGNDPSDVSLKSGEWSTVTVPLKKVAAGYWKDAQIAEEKLKNIVQWGVKLYAANSSKDAEPTVVKVRNPRLTSKKPPVITVKDAQGWVMRGELVSYGWLVTENGNISGKIAEIPGMKDGEVSIEWYDTWDGKTLVVQHAAVESGKLRLTAPGSDKADLAFILQYDQ